MDRYIHTTSEQLGQKARMDWKDCDSAGYNNCDINSSSKDSDDSPIISYRYDRYRHYAPYVPVKRHSEERERKSTGRVLAKLFFICMTMILFCLLMYIPVYTKINKQISKGFVAGWSIHTNRDTKIYIMPDNVTTIHEPNNLCPKSRDKQLFLLVVVVSSTTNFKDRQIIRETWGNYKKYLTMSKEFTAIREKYKSYNFSHSLFPNNDDLDPNRTDPMRINYYKIDDSVKKNDNIIRDKRSISGFSQLLPSLAEALKRNLDKELIEKTENLVPEEKRFEDEDDDDEQMLPEFDMNKELGDDNANYDNYYESNVMKIPPKGYSGASSIDKIMNLLKKAEFSKIISNDSRLGKDNKLIEQIQADPDFRLVFLLGMPTVKNDSKVQREVDDEIEKYGDIIQEGFVDSYNNLTLKSIMMLKWVVNHCNDTVRYILKADDDVFINMPNLVSMLRNKSKDFDQKFSHDSQTKEYLLIGDLICGARPVLDSKNKWYSPRYMYGGRVYPKYLSGTGYVLSFDSAKALYKAALRTPYFHLEDIYITGMCAARAKPRVRARDAPGFSYQFRRRVDACALYAHVSAHQPTSGAVQAFLRLDDHPGTLDTCERIRLTQVRRDMLRAKMPTKKLPVHKHIIVFH